MKTKEELDALRKEAEALSRKLTDLTEDELKEVTGGWHWGDNWGDEGYFQNDPEGSSEQSTNALRLKTDE